MQKKTFIILFTFLFLFTYICSSKEEMYPSYVIMTLYSGEEVTGGDEFFELLDCGDYILLPLVSLSRWLEIELDYSREKNILTAHSPETGNSVEVDLEKKIYTGFPDWWDKSPEAREGDFYVSPELIHHLTGAETEWLPRRQELKIYYTGYSDREKDEQKKEEPLIKSRPKEEKLSPDVTGPDFSLGSIQYKINFTHTGKELTSENLQLSSPLFLHGRAENWALSLGQELTYSTVSHTSDLNFPLLKAHNTENDREIILGDTRFTLSETLGRNKIRGLYIQDPHRQVSKSKAYTSLKGKAEEGSSVYLYVNNELLDEDYIYLGEKEYHFTNIPLKVNRLNLLRVKINKPGGETQEIIKKIASSLTIYEEGTGQDFLVLGVNRDRPGEKMLGGELKHSLSANSSLSWELGAKKKEDNPGQMGSILKLTGRQENKPVVLSLNWLSAKEMEITEHGATATLHYTMQNGHIRAAHSHIRPELTGNLKVTPGQVSTLGLQYDLNSSQQINTEMKTGSSLAGMEIYEFNEGNLSFHHRPDSRNDCSLTLSGGEKTESIETPENEKRDINWMGAILKGKTHRETFGLGGKIGYRTSAITIHSSEKTVHQKDISLASNASSRLNKRLNVGGNLEVDGLLLGKTLEAGSFTGDLRARWKPANNTYVNFSTLIEGEMSKENDLLRQEEKKRENELNISYFDIDNLVLTGEVKNTWLNIPGEEYLTYSAGLSHQKKEGTHTTNLNLSYIAPAGERKTAQEKVEFSHNRTLSPGLENSIKISRDYISLYEEKPVYKLSFGLARSLGFAGDSTTGQKYSPQDHNSYIGGLVFLDSNGSGKREEGEPLLEDIDIFREGVRTSTDDKGYFIFENVQPGLYEVGIDIRNLPADYDPLSQSKLVQIKENENIFLEFGLTINGALTGEIFLDKENTGKRNPEDIPLSWVELEIMELERTIYSRSDGSFYLENIPLGYYTLRVKEKTLPGGTKVTGGNEIIIEITPENLFLKNINIPVIYQIIDN